MSTTAPKPFVFVLMPFDLEFDDVYDLGIKPACENAGAYAERVDKQLFTESILQRIYNQISKADVIVSDMTGRNPNVFYETGYAHALGKKVILLTKREDDIPFDLKHYQHIIYGVRITDLKTKLEPVITWALQQPRNEISQDEIEFYVDGEQLYDNAELLWRDPPYYPDLKIDAYNPVDKQIKEIDFKLGILLSRTSDVSILLETKDYDFFTLPDANDLYILKEAAVLSPGSWTAFHLIFGKKEGRYTAGDSVSLTIRTFSKQGVTDLPFKITFTEQEL